MPEQISELTQFSKQNAQMRDPMPDFAGDENKIIS
jgi:hypothetical protein